MFKSKKNLNNPESLYNPENQVRFRYIDFYENEYIFD